LLGPGRSVLFEVIAGSLSAFEGYSTGGVTLQTAESFLRAGARALGVGGDLVNLTAIDAGHPEVITESAMAYLKIVAEVRGK